MTDDEIKLTPLPYALLPGRYTSSDMKAYAQEVVRFNTEFVPSKHAELATAVEWLLIRCEEYQQRAHAAERALAKETP